MRFLRYLLAVISAATVLIIGAGMAEADSPVRPGVYSIGNAAYSSQVLDINDYDGRVVMHNAIDVLHQHWDVEWDSGTKGFTIRNMVTGTYLGIDGDAAAMVTVPTTWRMNMQYDGRFTIEPTTHAGVLTCTGTNGAAAMIAPFHGHNDQLWRFLPGDY